MQKVYAFKWILQSSAVCTPLHDPTSFRWGFLLCRQASFPRGNLIQPFGFATRQTIHYSSVGVPTPEMPPGILLLHSLLALASLLPPPLACARNLIPSSLSPLPCRARSARSALSSASRSFLPSSAIRASSSFAEPGAYCRCGLVCAPELDEGTPAGCGVVAALLMRTLLPPCGLPSRAFSMVSRMSPC